jgi:hypothetical protein
MSSASFSSTLFGQDVAPQGKADDSVELRVVREFEDLARPKKLIGKLEPITLLDQGGTMSGASSMARR